MTFLNLALNGGSASLDPDELILEESCLDVVRGNLVEKVYSDIISLNERSDACKLYAANADLDKMVAFYEESEPKTSQTVIKKKSLIKKAWESICRFLRNIKEKYFKKKISEIPNDAEFVVPAETVKEIKTFKTKAKDFIAGVKRFGGKVKNSKVVVSIISALCEIKRAVKSGFIKIKGKIKLFRSERKAKRDAKKAAKDIPAGSVVITGSEVKEIINDLNNNATELENLASSTLPNDEMAAVDELHDVTGKASPDSKTFTPSEIDEIRKAQAELAEIEGSSVHSEVTNNVDACREVRAAVSDVAGEMRIVASGVIPTISDSSDSTVTESFDDDFIGMASKAAAIAVQNRQKAKM